MRLDDIWFSSDLLFIRLYLPMKSISNSDRIYLGDCLPEIYSQVSPYFGEISLSQHLSQGGWSNRGPVTYRSSFSQAGLSNWEAHTQKHRDPLCPLPASGRLDRMNSRTRSSALGRVCKQAQDRLCGQENGSGPEWSGPAPGCHRAMRTRLHGMEGHGPPGLPSCPSLSDCSVDRCMLLAAARASWQDNSNLSSQK